jgi:protein CpxP
MKKTAIAVTVVAALITAVLLVPSFAGRGQHGVDGMWRHARGGGGFGLGFEHKVERLVHKLDLSQAQREQVFAVLDETRPARREIRWAFADQRRAFMQLQPTDADYQDRLTEIAGDMGKLTNRMVVLLGETRAKVAALLTEEQRQQLQNLRQERWGQPRSQTD